MKKRELPDTVYIPDMENWAPVGQFELLEALARLQKGRCPFCNKALTGIIDIHECIVTKGDVQSWPDKWKFLIINLYNCIAVHRDCHQHGNRERWWDYKCFLFGHEEMEWWYYNLPFKSLPRRFT